MHQFYGEVLSLKEKKSMERISSLRRQDCPKAAHSQGRPNCPVTGVAAALPAGCARLAAGSMHKLRGNKSPHLEGNAKRFYSSCCCRRRCCCHGGDGGDATAATAAECFDKNREFHFQILSGRLPQKCEVSRRQIGRCARYGQWGQIVFGF